MINRKPNTDEYPPFASRYIATVGDCNPLEMLRANQSVSYELFSNLTPEKANHTYFPGKWTIKESLAHMIDTERVFAYRALCFSRGETKELPGFDQDVYAVNGGYDKRDIADLANEFKLLREANLYMINALSDDQLNARGIASNSPVSVWGVIYMMAGHEQHHLNILHERYL